MDIDVVFFVFFFSFFSFFGWEVLPVFFFFIVGVTTEGVVFPSSEVCFHSKNTSAVIGFSKGGGTNSILYG